MVVVNETPELSSCGICCGTIALEFAAELSDQKHHCTMFSNVNQECWTLLGVAGLSYVHKYEEYPVICVLFVAG